MIVHIKYHPGAAVSRKQSLFYLVLKLIMPFRVQSCVGYENAAPLLYFASSVYLYVLGSYKVPIFG